MIILQAGLGCGWLSELLAVALANQRFCPNEKCMIAIVDARGLKCPLPLLKAKQALRPLTAGEQLTVLATDSASKRDFGVFAEHFGHGLVCTETEAELTFIFTKNC